MLPFYSGTSQLYQPFVFTSRWWFVIQILRISTWKLKEIITHGVAHGGCEPPTTDVYLEDCENYAVEPVDFGGLFS